MSCDSFDLDSISQLSLADSASNSVADLYKSASRAEASLQPLPSLKAVSTDNIPNLELSYHGPRYVPHSYESTVLYTIYPPFVTIQRADFTLCTYHSWWDYS